MSEVTADVRVLLQASENSGFRVQGLEAWQGLL